MHDGCVSADDKGASGSVTWFVALKAYSQTLDSQLGLVAVLVHEGGTRCP